MNMDMPMIHRELALQKGWLKPDGTANAGKAQAWLREQSLTPHHTGGSSVQLVPTEREQDSAHGRGV